MGLSAPYFILFWFIEGILFLIAGIYCLIILIVSKDIIFNPDIGQKIKFIMIANLIVIFIRVLILIPIINTFGDDDEILENILLSFFLLLLILTNLSLGITLHCTSDSYKNDLVEILVNKGSLESKQVLKSKLDIQMKPIKFFSIISLILVNACVFIYFSSVLLVLISISISFLIKIIRSDQN